MCVEMMDEGVELVVVAFGRAFAFAVGWLVVFAFAAVRAIAAATSATRTSVWPCGVAGGAVVRVVVWWSACVAL